MDIINLSIVSYLNSKPFIYGLENYNDIKNLISTKLDVPSECANKVINNQVDVGLIPSAVLKNNPQLHIFSNYCLSTNSEVQTVLLLSNYKLEDINKIYLDSDSKTSVNLVKILAKNFWNINTEWIENQNISEIKPKKNSAIVAIGDKAFAMKQNFKFSYDLAQEWHKFTGKSFVFAVWASNKILSNKFIETFNKALNFGIHNIDIVSEQVSKNYPQLTNNEIKYYLTQNMDYSFNVEKKESLNLFLKYLGEL